MLELRRSTHSDQSKLNRWPDHHAAIRIGTIVSVCYLYKNNYIAEAVALYSMSHGFSAIYELKKGKPWVASIHALAFVWPLLSDVLIEIDDFVSISFFGMLACDLLSEGANIFELKRSPVTNRKERNPLLPPPMNLKKIESREEALEALGLPSDCQDDGEIEAKYQNLTNSLPTDSAPIFSCFDEIKARYEEAYRFLTAPGGGSD